MKKTITIVCLLVCLIALESCSETSNNNNVSEKKVPFLSDARKGFKTVLINNAGYKGPVEKPPVTFGRIVIYPTEIGNMAAYLSNIPDDGKSHPAMIWVAGGFGNDISDVWTKQNEDNDQSASVIKEAGIIMMYPSQRGGNENPGNDESCFGEINDIISAAKFLAKQKGIDPKRIYLGGHSTGGTKVLLVAECSNIFRAVFSLGPVTDVRNYGESNLNYKSDNVKESELRAPIRWLSSIQTPVFVFEGTERTSNIDEMNKMKDVALQEQNSFIHFYGIKGKDHFSVIQPVSKIIAQEILKDNNGGDLKMRFEEEVQVLNNN